MRFGPLIGAWELALGRPGGMARFGDSPQAFLASLAPWIAFPLVYAVWAMLSGEVAEAITFMLLTMVAQLTPPVLSHWLAVRWGREAAWLRYSTAYNWCQWAVGIAFVLLMVASSILFGVGVPMPAALGAFMVAFVVFCLWLNWSLARYGMGLGRGRAALLVLLINVVTFMLVAGPQFIAQVSAPPPASPAVGAAGVNGSGS